MNFINSRKKNKKNKKQIKKGIINNTVKNANNEVNKVVKDENKKPEFVITRCKREDYIKAWNNMYLSDKQKFNNNKLYDGINPSLNKKPLGTETDNYCTVVYDTKIPTEGFQYGKPVGIFCFVVTPRKVIGKQFVVHPDYLRKGLGKALLLVNEKTLQENGLDKYYIGCSHCSASMLKKYWNVTPYDSDVEGDLYKFNVDLKQTNFANLYKEYIEDNKSLQVI